MKYIISTTLDYADEFDYPIVSVFTQELKDFLTNTTILNTLYKDKEEFYFGTNEYLELDSEDILELVNGALPITDEELATLEKFNIHYFGIDILEVVNERLIDEGYISGK